MNPTLNKPQRTEQEIREWALKHHTSIIASLAKGNAALMRSELGFLWFGPADGDLRVAESFISRYGFNAETCNEFKGDGWPHRVIVGPFTLVRQYRIDEDGYQIYRREV